ncbi:HU family DNA-binding protein [Bacteroides sp. 224]|uniref:HU family DNA-binding protein n=1 Tax=Bacteroides sp. 224 TaxID=2302936 RepID=UPI0013D1A872|nr:HU family DNA-binding protein [Bacteroides sp. 224]NDV64375.1 DNA-binding protein [Bacteroides sp. 224]
MPIEFEFYEIPDLSEKGKSKYCARTVTLKTVSTNELAARIQHASSLTIGDVKGVLVQLSQVLADELAESNRVHIEGIGYFQVTLKTTTEIDPKKTRAQSVWFKSVKFRADKDLNKKLKYVQTERARIRNHSVKLTHEQIDKKLEAFFQKNSFITRRLFQELCGMTTITASRHIKRLKEEGKIKNENTRMQPVYVWVPQ